MKTKTLLIALIAILTAGRTFAQTIPFTFIKSCIIFERAAFTEDMSKKKFYVLEDAAKNASNKLMEGATFYCNEKERELGNAEIDILSQINGAKKIVEITFKKGNKHDYTKNYGEIYNQMLTVLNKTASIQSKKYKTEVNTFTKNGVYYYTYKVGEVPVIVISNYKIDEEYF
ncbi:hypothetical protein BH10BAC1_BH10BAC1_20970 [soil metagenome]